MIVFDRLSISDDGSQLYVDAHVSLATCFDSVGIQSLYICLGRQVYETQTIDPESNGYIYKKAYDEDVREIHECIHIDDEHLLYNKSTFSKDLFFVYVGCTSVPEGCECYSSVGSYVLGVTFDEHLLYHKVMQFTKDLAESCQIPLGFIDFILLWNAFKASVETEHYIPAIKYYNMLFDRFSDITAEHTKPCGCHG